MIKEQMEKHQKCMDILVAIKQEQNRQRRLADDIKMWNCGRWILTDLMGKWKAEVDFKSRVMIKLWKYYKREVEKC